MIPEAFLIAALALPIPSIHHANGSDSPDFTKVDFLREYKWLIDLLESAYPDNEFLIMPLPYDIPPPGWIQVPMGWRGHLIYRRPLKEGA